ncbi:MAG: hypothetical protein L0Y73_05925 [Candidatus Aminicenantes bacterium]|nr:hypothetical protein [Candidatus Aminicenantes bacterium]
MARLIFIFLDGVGVGKAAGTNPFYAAKPRYLRFYEGADELPGGVTIKGIDPLLGVAGIPQSATGQTSLFTGQNAPAVSGGHSGSYPNKMMRKIINEHNLLKKLSEKGFSARFINVYPMAADRFSCQDIALDNQGDFHFSENFPEQYKRRLSVTTCMLLANRQAPFGLKRLLEKRAIYQDYSNKMLIKAGMQLPEYSPETAAEIIFSVSREFDFILYEYFQTDVYAHRSSFSECCELVSELDRLIGKLVSLLDKEQDTLLITSDHGNLEDYPDRSHTLNPVPLFIWGRGGAELLEKIDSIAAVTPGIVEFFAAGKSAPTAAR